MNLLDIISTRKVLKRGQALNGAWLVWSNGGGWGGVRDKIQLPEVVIETGTIFPAALLFRCMTVLQRASGRVPVG
jgi:hypothetical protein